jgi:predicted RNA-binding protein associated with RNAse of E/G family
MLLKESHKENLVHMLGAGNHIPKKQHGYRNHYFAFVGGKDHSVLIEMQEAGLVYLTGGLGNR